MNVESVLNIEEQIKEIDNSVNKNWINIPENASFEDSLKIINEVMEKSIALNYDFGKALCQVTLANLYIKDIQKLTSSNTLISAIKLLKPAASYFEKEKDNYRASFCHNLFGWIYFYSNNYIKRLKHNKLSAEFASLTSDENLIVASFNNIGDTYLDLQEYDKAEYYFDKSLSTKAINPVSLIKKGKVNYLRNNYKLAIEYIDKALLLLPQRKNSERFYCSAKLMLGDIAFKNNEFAKAEEYLVEGLQIASENKVIEKQIGINLLLAKVFTANGKFESANKSYKEYFKSRNTLNIDSLKNQLQEFEYEEKLIKLNDAFAEVETEKNRLKHNNRNLQNFAHVASHDMKEPLRMISSFSQLLERSLNSKIDESEKEYLGYITNSASRLNTLINDILDYSKLTQLSKSFEKIDLNEVFRQLLVDLNLKVKDTKVEIKFHNELPSIYGLPSTVTRLFQNLLSNALKFTKPGVQPIIEINSIVQNDNVKISIQDNGIGISSENQHVIFEMFARLHAKTDYEGSGIGLAACAHIVEMHNGKIWVESELGEGATFFVSLPLQQLTN